MTAVADRLPRYRVRSLTGWPMGLTTTPARNARDLARRPPTVWQVQDSWDCWHVAVFATDEADANYHEELLNFIHEQGLRKRDEL